MSASKVSPKCEVCLEDMVEPRSLPCGHMFCINCLQQLIDKANNVTCPNDRKLFNVPSGKAADLARNFYLEDLLETLRSSQTSPSATCAEHVDKQAEIFCESCLKSLCCKCVLKHRAHDCFEYSESHDKCEQRVQQLLADVSKFQQAVDEEKTAKSRAVEAQFTACKRKVYAAVKKIHDIVQVLNATAEFLRNTTGQCEQLLLGTFKLASLDELQQEVAELSEAASSLSGDGLKLECRFEQVAELTQKLESRQGKLVKESIPELSRWFADCQLTRSLEKILQHATKLRQNLTNDTKDYLSLQQLSTALNAVNTAVMAEAQSATSRAAALPTSRTPSVVSPAASNAAIAVNRPVMSTVAQGKDKRRNFKPQQDILLLKEVIAVKPFFAAHGQQESSWKEVAVNLRESFVTTTFRAARDRFNHLIRVFQSEERDSLRRSGTNEEYEEREQLLTEVLQLQKEASTAKSEKRKQQMNDSEVAKKIRIEAMQALKAAPAKSSSVDLQVLRSTPKVMPTQDSVESSPNDSGKASANRSAERLVSKPQSFSATMQRKEERRTQECENESLKLKIEVEKIELEKLKLKVKEEKLRLEQQRAERDAEQHKATMSLFAEFLKRMGPPK